VKATALVAEDEAVLREELVGRLGRLWPELSIVRLAANGAEALDALEAETPDVVFLDINMPGATGLEVARAIDGRCHIVFITAYDAHAVEAFEHGAVDYVLKPYDDARLGQAVRRVKARLRAPPVSIEAILDGLAERARPREHLRWINASVGAEVRLITVDEVCYFQADTKYTRVVTADGEALIRRSLKELAEELDPARFWPVHRSIIVNAEAVAGVSRDLAGGMKLRLKGRLERLPVSDQHRRLFRQM
jgi:DNA-binding LytR/AlgR family response regulator